MNDFVGAWVFAFLFVMTFVLFVTYMYELVLYIVKKLTDHCRFN